MDFRTRLVLAGCMAAGAFALLMVAAPFMAPPGAFRGLDGTPCMIDGGWEGHGIASALYALGDVLCHQEEGRCLMLNGSQMPVCVRDLGISVGLCIGFLMCVLLGYRLSDRRFAVAGVVLVLVMVVEWSVETTGLDSMALRAMSGVSAGVGASLFLSWLLYRPDDLDGGGTARLGVRSRCDGRRRLAP